MDKTEKTFYIILVIVCLLFIGGLILELDARNPNHCQKQEMQCFRFEGVFLGAEKIQTTCTNNYDIKEIKCTNAGYLWERNNG